MARQTLVDLLGNMKAEMDPYALKDYMLDILQLYFDGLVDNPLDENALVTQDDLTLRTMLHNTGLAVSRYYRREENMVRYDCTEIFASMDIHRSNIIASGSKKLCKFRNLKYSEDEVKACIGASIDLLNKAGINLIIPVASGGFEPALLVADYLGVSNLFPIRYSIAHRFDKEVRIPRNIPLPMASQTINGKNVLIVDDISDTGNTAKRIAKWVTSLGPKRAFYLCVDAFVPAELENFGFEPIKRCGKGYLHSTET